MSNNIYQRYAKYGDVYRRCAALQEDGLIHLVDTTTGGFPDSLDWFLMKLFDIKVGDTKYFIRPINDFNIRVVKGEIDIGWLFGEHAVALLKAKMIQRGLR